MQGLFITGTDTGVGKTYVGSGIAKALRTRNVDVGVMKPVETGCSLRKRTLVPADALALARAAAGHDPLDLINPYRFQEALAPAVAAACQSVTIDLRTIIRAYRKLSKLHDVMIVEGAGGIMVPLSRRTTFLDLSQQLKLPVLIVARPNLGTLNHTRLTVMALQSRKLKIAGIVINESAATRSDLAKRIAPHMLETFTGVPVIGSVKFGSQQFDKIADKFFNQIA